MTSKQHFLRSHVLGIVAIIIAVGGTAIAAQAASNGDATASRGKFVTKAQFKKLKNRVAALEGKSSYPPSGPAGGSLAGSYPNPTLAANSVGTSQLTDGTVGSADLHSIYTPVSSVGTTGGSYANGQVSCNPGDKALGGGFSLADTSPTSSDVDYSTPDGPLTNPTGWIVRVKSSSSTTLFTWAVCLGQG